SMYAFSTLFLYFQATATAVIYSLSLHDALPICAAMTCDRLKSGEKVSEGRMRGVARRVRCRISPSPRPSPPQRSRRESTTASGGDRKSTRLNSSHVKISYAVFCLKKKTNNQ